ncbi:MAG: hypothetical protein QF619_14250 [Candidatus Binatia bacterium]|nr:hypothetical protein [Candidatus Binatia bacterium]
MAGSVLSQNEVDSLLRGIGDEDLGENDEANRTPIVRLPVKRGEQPGQETQAPSPQPSSEDDSGQQAASSEAQGGQEAEASPEAAASAKQPDQDESETTSAGELIDEFFAQQEEEAEAATAQAPGFTDVQQEIKDIILEHNIVVREMDASGVIGRLTNARGSLTAAIQVISVVNDLIVKGKEVTVQEFAEIFDKLEAKGIDLESRE